MRQTRITAANERICRELSLRVRFEYLTAAPYDEPPRSRIERRRTRASSGECRIKKCCSPPPLRYGNFTVNEPETFWSFLGVDCQRHFDSAPRLKAYRHRESHVRLVGALRDALTRTHKMKKRSATPNDKGRPRPLSAPLRTVANERVKSRKRYS